MRELHPRNARHAGFAILLQATLLVGIPPASRAAADALADAAGSYRIDESSSIRFAVDQVGGGGIKGSFPDYEGSFRIDGGNVGRSSVTITLYPKSVRASTPSPSKKWCLSAATAWPSASVSAA